LLKKCRRPIRFGVSHWFRAGFSNTSAYDLGATARDDARLILRHVRFVEMSREILDRALFPLPVSLRTLDTLHLVTMDYLHRREDALTLASYDRRLLDAAAALGIEPAPL